MRAGASSFDLAIVGAGPAGAAAALGALLEEPSLRVALVDRAEFPRDKPCGDGVAPQVLDLLSDVGVTGLLEDRVPVRRLQLVHGERRVEREMARPAHVVPRELLDLRLHAEACAAGATAVLRRIGTVQEAEGHIALHGAAGTIEARLAIGADGAHSVLRRTVGSRRGPVAVAIRGYAPTPAYREGAQVIAFGSRAQPSYAWSFDRGDGLANVGYGELVTRDGSGATRASLLAELERLLPGAPAGGTRWRGHQLPLSTAHTPSPGRGRVLLAGDAAGLVNPMTGEGIYYAVLTGLLAGRSAARSLGEDGGRTAVRRYGVALRTRLRHNLRHTASAARLSRHRLFLDAGVRAAARDQAVFDDLVELGLADGRISPRVVRGLAGTFPGVLAASLPFPSRNPTGER